ncbi:MAG: pyruvate kinase alpha/beta domain-containing protein [Phycisphaeraceae bacterium]
MAHTAEITEAYAAERWGQQRRPPRNPRESRYRTAALAHGVSVVVRDLDARYVVMWSELGGGARLLSQNRLTVPILAVSSNPKALARMSLLFGVVPLHMPRPKDAQTFVARIDELLQQQHWAEPGDPIVIAHGEPLGIPGVTNKIRIHHVGDLVRAGQAIDE